MHIQNVIVLFSFYIGGEGAQLSAPMNRNILQQFLYSVSIFNPIHDKNRAAPSEF
jgi:hypothetical protein